MEMDPNLGSLHWQSQEKPGNVPKTPASASSADLQATGGGCGQLPLEGCRFQQPPAHCRKSVLKVSSEARSWRRGSSSHGPWIRPPPPPRHSTRHNPPPQVEGAAASGTTPNSPGRIQRRRKGGSGYEISCSRSLPEPPPHLYSDSPSSARYCSA